MSISHQPPTTFSVRHDGVDIGIGDGSVLAAKDLVGTEPQSVQQLLLAQLTGKKKTQTKGKKHGLKKRKTGYTWGPRIDRG